MIAPETAAILAPLRDAYRGRAVPAVFVPGALSEAVVRDLGARVRATPLSRFELAHRGHYRFSKEAREPALEASLVEIAEYFADEKLSVASSRWMVLGHGDYALRRDDDPHPEPPGRVIELVLDVSDSASGEADLVYARAGGALVFAAPQTPGGLAVVERAPGISRYQRYLTHRVGELEVTRLFLRTLVV